MTPHVPVRRPPFARLAFICAALLKGCQVNAAQMAAELEVCDKTIQRDIALLHDQLGVPLEYDVATKSYKLTGPAEVRIFGLPVRAV